MSRKCTAARSYTIGHTFMFMPFHMVIDNRFVIRFSYTAEADLQQTDKCDVMSMVIYRGNGGFYDGK